MLGRSGTIETFAIASLLAIFARKPKMNAHKIGPIMDYYWLIGTKISFIQQATLLFRL